MESRLFESFKRIGFRKWYERQLLSSHAHMVLAFLSVIALIGSEVDRLAALVDRLMNPAPPRAFAPLNIHGVLERVHRYFRRMIYDPNEAEECLSRTVVLLEESLRTMRLIHEIFTV